MVMAKNIEPGEQVAVGTPVITIGELDNVWVRAYISETDLGRVKVGQKARVTTDTWPAESMTDSVSPKRTWGGSSWGRRHGYDRYLARQGLRRASLFHLLRGGIHPEKRPDREGTGQARLPDQDHHPQPEHGAEAGHAGGRGDTTSSESGRAKRGGQTRPLKLTLIPFELLSFRARRSMDCHQNRQPDQALRRPHRRGRPQPDRGPGGAVRPGRPGRRRQDHHHADAHRHHGPDRRRGLGHGAAHRARGRGDQGEDRLHEPALRPLPRPDRAGEPPLLRRHLRRAAPGPRRKNRAAPRLQQPRPRSKTAWPATSPAA